MADAPPDAPNKKLRLAGGVVLVLALFAILIAAGWHAMTAWNGASGGAPMPTAGYVAMTLGVLFSLIVGCGLMALLFYSSRHGYDEPHYDQPQHAEEDEE
jgi:TRAP-type C4-dicarboxylate transport system permease small subunit